LPRQMNDILGQILFVLFVAVMLVTPLVILVLGIVNLTREKLHQGVIVLQAVAALGVWIILTVVLVSIFIMMVFEYPAYKGQRNEVIGNAIFLGGSLIYLLVSAVLIYWTKRQTKRMPAMGISC